MRLWIIRRRGVETLLLFTSMPVEVLIPNPFEKELGIPLPQCCSLGSCCKGASPSTPYHQLMERARDGDDFARGFFSMMIPYASHADAERVVPGLVERSLKAARKLDDFSDPERDLVFYHCRYQTPDNKCGVWEDRPQFCRDYPDTPFVVMAPGCAFEGWGQACRKKYSQLKEEVGRLKELKAELDALKRIQAGLPPLAENVLTESGDSIATLDAEKEQSRSMLGFGLNLAEALDEDYRQAAYTERISVALSLTPIFVGSPLRSIYFLSHL